MNAIRKRTIEELKNLLDEQIRFLEISAESFDKGFNGEAKRLATTLRVLIHDTEQSHSLLYQLDKKDKKFMDTAFDYNPRNMLSYGGLVAAAHIAGGEVKYIALLDEIPPPFQDKWIDFETWWTKHIFKNQDNETISRKKIILTAANKEGGAHVDPDLDIIYDELISGSFMGWEQNTSKGKLFISGSESAAIRQITHEVLKTLKPGYSKKPEMKNLTILANFSMTTNP